MCKNVLISLNSPLYYQASEQIHKKFTITVYLCMYLVVPFSNPNSGLLTSYLYKKVIFDDSL